MFLANGNGDVEKVALKENFELLVDVGFDESREFEFFVARKNADRVPLVANAMDGGKDGGEHAQTLLHAEDGNFEEVGV